jgi:replicative DNA helicase
VNETATPRLLPLAGLLDEWEADAIAARNAYETGTPRGPVTGLSELDSALGGCLQPGLNIAQGNAGVGKTCLALQIAATCCCPALYVSCEMKALELFRRHTARVTGKFLRRLKTGELPPAESLALARQAAEAAPLLTIADATLSAALPPWIAEAAETVKGAFPHLLVVIDSVHSWVEGWAGESPEYDAIGAGLKALRDIATRLNCCVLAVAEQNRAAMRAGKPGDVNAAAGSRKFEYGSECVLDLHRKADAKEDLTGEVEVTLTLAKNRNGAAGRRVNLLFNGALQTFR